VDNLVVAAQRGDAWAMQSLMRELSPYVGRICGAVALDHGDDAMQETMIAILRNLRSLREPAALRGWVRQIAVRESIRAVRRRGDWIPSESVLSVAAPATDVGIGVDVRATLAALEPDQRAILVLRDLEGFSEGEAAALLQIPEGTAKSRLHRARAAFRKRWDS
jgi:RNA polymerase sigma-70 factor (ECF subfamily)